MYELYYPNNSVKNGFEMGKTVTIMYVITLCFQEMFYIYVVSEGVTQN